MRAYIALLCMIFSLAANAVDLEAISLPEPDDKDDPKILISGEKQDWSQQNEKESTYVSASSSKGICEVAFGKPMPVSGGQSDERTISYQARANGKLVYNGVKKFNESEIYNSVEKMAREKLKNHSTLNQKQVVQLYLESNKGCKPFIAEAEKDSSDYHFGLLGCMGNLYEKNLHREIRKDLNSKLSVCKMDLSH